MDNLRDLQMLTQNLRRLYEPLLSREALIACALIGAALLASIVPGLP
jgi:hypothetical protein